MGHVEPTLRAPETGYVSTSVTDVRHARQSRPDDAAIIAALREHRGNISRAAESRGWRRTSLRLWAEGIAEARVILADRAHTNRPRRHTDAEILDALAKHGTVAATARALGYCREAVRQRLDAMRGRVA